MSHHSKCILCYSSDSECEIINEYLDEWYGFIEKIGECDTFTFHLEKALMNHIITYRRNALHRISLIRHKDDLEAPSSKGEAKNNCRGKNATVNDFFLCCSLSPGVRRVWKDFIEESNLQDKNAYHIQKALKNYKVGWERTHSKVVFPGSPARAYGY